MIAVLRQRNFTLLWFAGLLSFMGSWMLSIALPVAIYQMTESAFAVSIMLMLRTIPRVVLGSVAGVFVDRWERKRLMVLVKLLSALVVAPILLVQSVELLWLIYVAAFLESVLGQFFAPAEHAMLPALVDENHLAPANALNALNNNLGRLIGPAVGGLIMANLGLSGVITGNVLVYITAGLLIALITVTSKPVESGEAADVGAALGKPMRQWLDGLRLIKQNYTLRLLFTMAAITSIGEGIISVLFVPFVTEILKGEALELGWLMSAQAVGGLLGGLFIGWVAARISMPRLLGISAVAFGVIDLIIFNYSSFVTGLWIALVLFVIVGVPGMGLQTGFMTLLQTATTDEYRGRIFGALMTFMAIFTFLGMAFAGTAADIVGVLPVINLQGIGYVCAGVLCLVGFSVRASIKQPHVSAS